MHTKHNFFLLIFLSSLFFGQAQSNRVFRDISFGESLAEVQKKIWGVSKEIKVYRFKRPNFPLAKKTESHLIATNVSLDNGMVTTIAFAFADDRLSLIQVNGNVKKSLGVHLKSKPRTYIQYQVHMPELMFFDYKKDIAWILSKEAVHPNLFTWENPYINPKNARKKKYKSSVKHPDFVKMGENLTSLMPLLETQANFVYKENLDKQQGTKKAQANCFGIEYAGFPRKFELRFTNKKLSKIWILTAKAEEGRIRKKLIKQFGKASFSNDKWEVFNNWTVLLRKDKPEVLLLNNELASSYKRQYLK